MNALSFFGFGENIVVKEIKNKGSTLPIKIRVKDLRAGKVKNPYNGETHEIVIFLRKAK